MGNYTTYADPIMAPVEPSWLVPGFLEFGQVVLLTGPGGSAKSFLTVHWAARTTRGELPGVDGVPSGVGLINMEDDPNTATAWRLAAEGADLGRIVDLSESAEGEPAELPRDSGLLRRAIDENGLRLLIIDPLSAVSSKSLTTVLQARKIIMPLQRAARETGCVILVVHHVRKDGMIAGSKGLTDSVRMALSVAPDEQVPTDRVLSVAKTNGTLAAAPVRYTLEGDGHGTRVAWLDRETVVQRRTSWRDDLAARREARTGGAAAGPLPAAVPVSGPAPLRVAYNAFIAKAGRSAERILAGTADPSVARAACEGRPEARALADAGMPLQWAPDGRGGWKAGTPACAFAVGAHQVPRAAV